MLVLRRGENRKTWGKTSQSRVENQQTQPTYGVEFRNRSWATLVEGECSHHCASPAPLREMNAAISRGIRSQKPILQRGPLREEIPHWLFLENWDNPLTWRDEHHILVSVATDTSVSGWEDTILSPIRREFSECWFGEELTWDVATKSSR